MKADVKLYQYAVLFTPSKKEQEEGQEPVLIVDITTILASNDQEVLIMASRAIPANFTNRLDQVNIIVRPF